MRRFDGVPITPRMRLQRPSKKTPLLRILLLPHILILSTLVILIVLPRPLLLRLIHCLILFLPALYV